jgi:DTW domain-containing protein YfiP
VRAFCWHCRRSGSTCLCQRVEPFDPRVELVIVAHPKEAWNAIGSARIVFLAARGTRWFEGKAAELDQNVELARLCSDPGRDVRVLYPGSGARDLGELRGQLGGDGRRLTIILIDGTWHQAKCMLRGSRILSGLPQVAFSPRSPSRYRIRVQPRQLCLSTAEAAHEVLDLLEPEGASPGAPRPHDSLLRAFDWMVQFQIDTAARNPAVRFLSRRLSSAGPERKAGR